MKKTISVILLAALLIACGHVSGVFASDSQDSIVDKVGDWFALLGKSEDEKEMIAARRRAARISERMRKEAAKSMEEFNKKMKSAFGK